VASWPEFRPSQLLRALVARGVDFVVIGGYAAIAHGSAQLTRDLDICFGRDPANLQALGAALVDLDARLRGIDQEEAVPFVPDAGTLKGVQLLTLDTREGPLDVQSEPDGAPGYATLRARAQQVEVAGVRVLVASLEDLMRMKEAAGRPKDLIVLEELEAIRRLSRRRRTAG
jgi:hypothetical protein